MLDMALTDTEYARIAYFLGYSSTQHMYNIKTKIIGSFGLTPTLVSDRENRIRDLLKVLEQYKKDIRSGEQNAGVYQMPGQRLDPQARTNQLIQGALNCVCDLEVETDVAAIGDVFNRGRGTGSVRVSR
jgi:hypothetical protein